MSSKQDTGKIIPSPENVLKWIYLVPALRPSILLTTEKAQSMHKIQGEHK